MFSTLPAASLGHVVIDESGQATPQSAAGLLMRAKRALVMGDQRQLEPVVLTPTTLERYLARGMSSELRIMVSPLSTSLQALVDRQSPLGTYLGNDDNRLWISTPFLVHRRCADPMFRIANQIAYDGLMQDASGRLPGKSALGPSSWFQVAGAATSKQWVPAQGKICEELLLALFSMSSTLPDIFIITPFREVKRMLKQRIPAFLRKQGYPAEFATELGKRIGTVHTFQGKEADCVFLVLGCDFSTGAAADWAGERPNLLNVAITRARSLLYVIGDRNVWHNRGYFSDLEKGLPAGSIL